MSDYKDISNIKYIGETLNLDKIQVFYEDEDPNSLIFGVQSIQDKYSIGKHAIFINPSENFVINPITKEMNRLKISTQILAEIVDKDGNRIYFDYPWKPPTGFTVIDGKRLPLPLDNEFVRGYRGSEPGETGLALSMEIFDNISDGTATIYLVGELENVPSEWVGTYNARWKRNITIEKNSINTSKLYFYNTPTVEVSEIVKDYTVYTFSSPTTSSIGAGYMCEAYTQPAPAPPPPEYT